MDKFDQMANAVTAAAVALKPPPEYCLLPLDWWQSTCMTKAEWSGWMQAVGSIAAIAGAFFLANSQHLREIRKEEDRANDENTRTLFWLKMLIIHIQRTSKSIADSAGLERSVGKLPYMRIQISSALVPFATFPFIKIQDEELVLAVMEIWQHACMAEKGFDASNSGALVDGFSELSAECNKVLLDFFPKSNNST